MSDFMRPVRRAVALWFLAALAVSSGAGGAEPVQPGAGQTTKPGAKGKGGKTDFDLIQGTWVLESVTGDGKKESVPEQALFIIFRDDLMITKEAGQKYYDLGWFALDETKTPRAIEVGSSIQNRKFIRPSIYDLAGDRLTICWPEEHDGKRPTKIESRPGSKTVVLDLKRDKTAKEFKDFDGSGYAKAIVGKWRTTHHETAFQLSGETEFTKDGRVLRVDFETKEWVEKYTYRFDKAALVLTPTKAGGKGAEQRVWVARITDTELHAASPRGIMERGK